MKSKLFKTAFILCAFFLLINTTFAFDDLTTHPAITDEIVDFYNLFSEIKLNIEQKELIISGVMQEDTPPRWINHFYDPVREIGWTGRNTGIWPTSLVRYFSGTVLSSAYPVSSLNWLHNQELQTYYKAYKGNKTWEKAIYEYINGDKKEALHTLGYVLHLIEDMAVPDHTRDDPHAHEMRWATGDYGSPLEEYGKRYNKDNFIVADKLKKEGYKPIVKDNIDNYLISLAEYSNNYFFSKDTINDSIYQNPKIVREDEKFGYGKDKNGEEFKLVKIIKRKIVIKDEFKEIKEYFLLENEGEEIIISQYFTRLSREAVIYGAGVIDLFFKEIEMIESGRKEAPELFVEEDKNIVKKIITLDTGLGNVSVTGEFFKIVNFTTDTYSQTKKIVLDTISDAISLLQENNENNENLQSAVIESQKKKEIENKENNLTQKENEKEINRNSVQQNEIEIKKEEEREQKVAIAKKDTENNTIEEKTNTKPTITTKEKTTKKKSSENFNYDDLIPVITPSFGGGGGGGGNNTSVLIDKDITAPNSPIVISPNLSGTLNTSVITFEGKAETRAIVEASYSSEGIFVIATTTADASENWKLKNLSFAQGTTTIAFTARDGSGNVSKKTEYKIFTDSVSGEISLSSPVCQESISIAGCLTSTTTFSFLWSFDLDDLDYYIINKNGETATTTATSAKVIASNNSIYNFSIKAQDKAGNVTATSTLEVEIRTSPIVINEIAWMGTATSSYDEWIELYNASNKNINLSGWTFIAEDGAPYIPLSGSISAKEYFLIERTDDNTISDILADMTPPFSGVSGGSGLNNSGEDLSLLYFNGSATSTMDEVSKCGSNWCGGMNSGFNTSIRTMERYSPYISGNSPSNWGNAIGEFILNGKDAEGNSIIGTPKTRNSISYLIKKGISLSENKKLTLTEENSPYLIGREGLTIDQGEELTLEKGVVIKFVNPNEPSLVVNGALITKGTSEKPVVFTAFTDDEYGGDMNGDLSLTSPAPKYWAKILFNNSSNNSSFKNTIIRYGGRWFNNTDMKASVAVDEANVSFDNITVEYPGGHGLFLKNSESSVINSKFRYATSTMGGSTPSAGIYVGGGAPTISDSEFKENKYGLHLASAPSASVSGNTFINNENEAIYVSGPVSFISNNIGSGNGLNAIMIGNGSNIAQVGTTTLKANTIPYLIVNDARVIASSTLAFDEGIIIKAYNNINNKSGRIIVGNGGSIIHNGSTSDSVIFTSINDDSVGGSIDTATTSPLAGDWYGITVEHGGTFSLKGFTLRYAGGAIGWPTNRDGIRIEAGKGTTTIANALIENNLQIGISAKDAILDISNTTIRNHPGNASLTGYEFGLYFTGSSAVLSNMIFENNQIDIGASNSSIICVSSCGSPITSPSNLLN